MEVLDVRNCPNRLHWRNPAALLTACSKPMSPMTSREGEAGVGAAASSEWSSASVQEPQTARARLRFVGDVVELRADFSTHLHRNAEFLVDTVDPWTIGTPLRDTVPAYSVLKQVRWRVDGANGPKFIVDNHPEFEPPTVGFPIDGVVPGIYLGQLRAPERAGGGVATYYFRSNFLPESWWAGPDPSRFPPSSDGDGRAVDVLDWANLTTTPAWPPDGRGYLAPDSFQFLPHTRRPVNDDYDRRTFYEIWGNRIYARSEGDAVHLGAWVIFATGGFDPDSPYKMVISARRADASTGMRVPARSLSRAVRARETVGPPVGVRHRVQVRLANGQLTQPSYSTTHPIFDVSSVFYSPAVASYERMIFPGKAYAVVPGVDGHGQFGLTPEDLAAVADRVDAGGGSAEDQVLRRRVLTFFVSGSEPASRSAGGLARGR